MNKQVIKRIIIIMAVCLIVLAAFTYVFFESQKIDIKSAYHYWMSDTKRQPNPNFLSDYPENRAGYYQFDPQTILASLDRGKDVFIPSSIKNPNDVDSEYPNIVWAQSDFLRVANTLSQQVWHEPLDLDGWGTYLISFEGGCNNHFSGFDSVFTITYYKTIKTGWDTVYTARHIDLMPVTGVAAWAGDGDFSTPSIFGWQKIELTKFKTTAEQAVRIADENGGKAARLNNDKCQVSASIIDGDWFVDYSRDTFNVFINPFTGEIRPTK